MADYTHEYSNFPNTVMTAIEYNDVTDSVATLINQIKTLQAAGNYYSATLLIAQNPSIKQYIPCAEDLNKIGEEIRNAQIYAKQVKQTIYTDETEPVSMIDGDVWIGGE